MTRPVFIQCLSVLLCIAAAFVSHKLFAKHVTGSSGSGWFETVCQGGDGSDTGARLTSNADCAAVLASPHSYWPPRREDEPPGTPHFPVAFLGLVNFSLLGVWLIGVGRPSHKRRWFHLITLVWVVCGLAGSLRYAFIMFAELDEWCPWCLLVHILNLLIVICVSLLWPREPRRIIRQVMSAPTSTKASEKAPKVVARPSLQQVGIRPPLHAPSALRVAATLGIMLIVVYGSYGQSAILASGKTRATLDRCVATVKRIRANTATLVGSYDAARSYQITIGPDDPVRMAAQPDQETWDLVVFSDFLCPSCRRFAALLDDEIAPLFDRRLRIVFKHYPLDKQCNRFTARTTHRNACAASYVAEAARRQGGNDAFWKVHDRLFEQRLSGRGFGPQDPGRIAGELDLDGVQLRSDLQSTEVAARVARDIELARTCGVTGTPAVFLNGKRVDPLAMTEIGFWDEMANRFWTEVGETRPASTIRRAQSATPDTQGPTDAP